MNALFLMTSAILFTALLIAGVRYLPGERWQFAAVIPVYKRSDANWQGTNLTAYGLLIATSTVVSILYALILLQAAGEPLGAILAVVILLLAICVPAARGMARLVEKKQHTFTIGGAFFCGLIATPVLIFLVNAVLAWRQLPQMHVMVVLAAVSIGYVLGEGLGRLACISFGCCYGKPLKACSPLTRKLYAPVAVVFTSATHKAVYEGDLAGEKLIPVQAITSGVYTATTLVAAYCFLQSHFTTAFLLSLFVSQLWRCYSETLRADFRGFSAFSAYQKMSLAALPLGLLAALLLPTAGVSTPLIADGLTLLFQPLPMISLQVLWVVLLLHFGRSTVTTATLQLHIVEDRL